MVVRRKSRKFLASILRDFVSGRITNRVMIDQFDRVPDGDSSVDRIIRRIEFLYDDSYRVSTFKTTGATEENNEVVFFQRCLSFLNTDLELEDPPKLTMRKVLYELWIVALNIPSSICGKKFQGSDKRYDCWPYSQAQLEQEKTKMQK